MALNGRLPGEVYVIAHGLGLAQHLGLKKKGTVF